jgi:integrase
VWPSDIRVLLDQFSDIPGTGNNLLGALRAVSSWGLERGHFDHSITEAVKPFKSQVGHRPWTASQCAAAERQLTGMVRRAYFLARYTGQRGSDVVRLGPTFLDDGGFRLAQQKTKREVWCPIEDRLAAEMATWIRTGSEMSENQVNRSSSQPLDTRFEVSSIGPYLHQHWGKVYSRKLLTKQFADAVAKIPELAGVTFHGLRGTRVVELRQRGASSTQIQDQVGMSLAMIERYCRFADKKANGKAALIALRRTGAEAVQLASGRRFEHAVVGDCGDGNVAALVRRIAWSILARPDQSALRLNLPPGGNVPPVTAARRMGLSPDAFQEALPNLLARGFPSADPTTGKFDLDAIDAWRGRRHPS